MIKKFLKLCHEEAGQSLVEFTLIMVVIIFMLMLPADFYLYIRNKMILKNAASESISELRAGNVSEASIENILRRNYSGKLDLSKVSIELSSKNSRTAYNYYVYNSELAKSNAAEFAKQFDKRPADYGSETVKLNLKYSASPVTFLGKQFLGNSYVIETGEYSRDIKVD